MAELVIPPGWDWRPSTPSTTPLARVKWVTVHIPAGNFSGQHYNGYVNADGTAFAKHEFNMRSASVVEGNPYTIAIVTADTGPPFAPWTGANVPAFTDAQIVTLAQGIAWCCARFGLAPERAVSSCLDSAGHITWHREGINGTWPPDPLDGRQPGCQNWSLSTGKSCPGDRRIWQMVNVVIPMVAALLRGDMVSYDKMWVENHRAWEVPHGSPDPLNQDPLARLNEIGRAVGIDGRETGNQLAPIKSEATAAKQEAAAAKTQATGAYQHAAAANTRCSRLETSVASLHTKVDSLAGGGTPIDYERIATMVADKLAQRLVN